MRGLGLFLGFQRAVETAPAVPTISGVGYVGYTLTASAGSTFQWQRSGVDIPLATAQTYVVTLADEGLPVRCVVDGVPTAAIEQWVPTDLGAALENWWDAEDSTTITIATGVSAWLSKGVLAGSVVQATAARQPAYSATGWGGARPAVTFDGVSPNADFLVLNGNADRCRNQPGYRVARTTRQGSTASPTDNRALSLSASGATKLTVGASSTQFNMGARRVGGDAYAFTAPSAFANDANPHARMDLFLFATGQAQQRIDGTAGATTTPFTSGNSGDVASDAISIGAGNTGAQFIGMTLHEMLCIRGAGTDAENEKIEAYLLWRSGDQALLPVGHTWKASAPTP